MTTEDDDHAVETAARIEAEEIETRARQYEAYVQWAERLIDRRAEANRFYLALNSVVVGAIGFLFSDQLKLVIAPVEAVAAALALLGVVMSWNWRCIIKSQREIVKEKFEVVHDLETRLPFQPYTHEWNRLDGQRRRISAGRFELRLPTLFSLVYLAMLVWLTWLVVTPAWTDLMGWITALTGR